MRGFGRRLREAKSLRAFAFEVLIVVVGVLIALGAQQLVEEWSWQQKVAAGEQRLKDEAHDSVYALAEQITVGPCVDSQLLRLDEKLRTPGPWNGVETLSSQLIPRVISSPSRPFATGLWETLGAEGTSLHFEGKVAVQTASYYEQIRLLNAAMEKRREDTAALNYLARPVQLSSETRAQLLEKIAAIRSSNAMLELLSVQAMERLQSLGRLKPIAAIEAEMAEIRASPSSTVAICEKRGLPLGDWQAALDRRTTEMRALDERLKSAPK